MASITVKEMLEFAAKLNDVGGGRASAIYFVAAAICERLDKLIELVEEVPEPVVEDES